MNRSRGPNVKTVDVRAYRVPLLLGLAILLAVVASPVEFRVENISESDSVDRLSADQTTESLASSANLSAQPGPSSLNRPDPLFRKLPQSVMACSPSTAPESGKSKPYPAFSQTTIQTDLTVSRLYSVSGRLSVPCQINQETALALTPPIWTLPGAVNFTRKLFPLDDRNTLFYLSWQTKSGNNEYGVFVQPGLDSTMAPFKRLLKLPAGAVELSAAIKNTELAKSAQRNWGIDQISVVPVAYSSRYLMVVAAVLFLLLLTAAEILRCARLAWHSVYALIFTLVVAIVLISMLGPWSVAGYVFNSESPVQSQWVITLVETLEIHLFNLAHVILFAVLTLLAIRFSSVFAGSLLIALLVVVLFALFSEVIQLHSLTREASVTDLMLDLLGIFVGLILLKPLRHLKIVRY